MDKRWNLNFKLKIIDILYANVSSYSFKKNMSSLVMKFLCFIS